MLILPNGRRLNYAEYGDSSGVPAVYCHGVPGSHQDGCLADAPARSLGVRLIVPERPGYGLSDSQDDVTLSSVAGDIVALVHALKLDHPAMLGFSGGGSYAMAAATALGEKARRLVLVSSFAPFGDPRLLADMSESLRQVFTLAAGDPTQFGASLASATADADSLAEAVIAGLPEVDKALFADARLRAAYRASCALALRQGPRALLADFALMTKPWNFDPAAITCPVTLWHGLSDRNAPPAMSKALALVIPGARLNLIPGAGHCFIWQRWKDVLASAVEI